MNASLKDVFPTLSPAQHTALLIDYNSTAAPYPAKNTIVQLFAAQVEKSPDAEAVRSGATAVSYRELDRWSGHIARQLRGAGVGRGSVVAILMDHSIEVVSSILGVLKSGAAYVPLDPATPSRRIGMVLSDIASGSGGSAPVVLAQAHTADAVAAFASRVIEIGPQAPGPGDSALTTIPDGPLPTDLAYIIYTSGSTGVPKGVMVGHRSLVNYIHWAESRYCRGELLSWPLFSSLAFDLTVTSIFTPLVSGGRLIVYAEEPMSHGVAVRKVVVDNQVDIIKLTPAHLSMIRDLNLGASRIRRFIVGGEEFKTTLARDIHSAFDHPVEIYNEYGPTEATVGCMIHRFDPETDTGLAVPIGIPAANTGIYLLDEAFRPVPPGKVGEMYISGDCLALGYFGRPDLTSARFLTIEDPRRSAAESADGSGPEGGKMVAYRTGDLGRWSSDGRLEFLGRRDHQVKIGGARIELGEIEARLATHPKIKDCVATVFTESIARPSSSGLQHCSRCGLASDFPGVSFDSHGVCSICNAFDTYVDKAQAYFRTPEQFQALVHRMKAERTGDYDCIVLYSGGKDSSYMLYKLCELGLKPLVFTLDNGFISDEAKANIRRVVQSLEVDVIFGGTPHMNDIFVDSLKRFSNVCNGCFKTIYTLSTQLALEKNIRFIVTGLSRGQFFETRLTEDVFKRRDFDVERLDALVLEARKAYHRRDDAVSAHLAVDVLREEGTLDEVEFVDFYRYWSVPLDDLYAYLLARGWTKPKDTGRSTNCRINDLGIYLHKKQRGFHNYALPYSWDVRLKQKTREQALDELDDEIDETKVRQLMAEIGYVETSKDAETGLARLVAYYASPETIPAKELRSHLAEQLPDYMIPSIFIRLDTLPLTKNGKVDREALPKPTSDMINSAQEQEPPLDETQGKLAAIWRELLNLEHVGIHDEFFELGGHSLLALRAVSRIRDDFDIELPLEALFQNATIASLAKVIEEMSVPGHKPVGASERSPPLRL
jgi:amino acid adenylation domain-containing protein